MKFFLSPQNPGFVDANRDPHLLSTYQTLSERFIAYLDDFNSPQRLFGVYSNSRREVDDLQIMFQQDGNVTRDNKGHLFAPDGFRSQAFATSDADPIFKLQSKVDIKHTLTRLNRRISNGGPKNPSIVLTTGITQSGWDKRLDVIVHTRIPQLKHHTEEEARFLFNSRSGICGRARMEGIVITFFKPIVDD